MTTGAAAASTGSRRCAHDPLHPRLAPLRPLRSENAGGIIAELVGRIRAYYDDRHRTIPELLKRRRGGARTRKRSDRTEAQILVLTWFAGGCDLESGLCGRWNHHKRSIDYWDSLAEIQQATGLSRWRVDNAISDLGKRCAGFVFRKQTDEHGSVAFTRITMECFEAFGVAGAVERLRARRRDEQRRAEKKAERRAPVAPVGRLIEGVSAALDPAVAGLRQSLPPDVDPVNFRQILNALWRERRDLSGDELEAEALRRARGKPP